MKKLLKLTSIILLLFLSFSCEKDDSQPNIESIIEQKKSTINSNQNFEIATNECDIIGSKFAYPNQTLTYTYTSRYTQSNINWTFSSGISIVSGQGTNTASFRFNTGFRSGFIKAFGEGFLDCEDIIYISRKDKPTNCGSVNGITQLNVLGNDLVKFFIPNGSLLINSGWNNPSYYWEFVCHASGDTVSSYDSHPYVDLSNCTGSWDVTVTVTVTNSQGDLCSFSKSEQLHPGGTGGF